MGQFETLLPVSLLIGNLVVGLLLLYKFMGSFSIDLDRKGIIKKILGSGIFLVGIPAYFISPNLWVSLAVLFVCGLVFLWTQFKGLQQA